MKSMLFKRSELYHPIIIEKYEPTEFEDKKNTIFIQFDSRHYHISPKELDEIIKLLTLFRDTENLSKQSPDLKEDNTLLHSFGERLLKLEKTFGSYFIMNQPINSNKLEDESC